MQCITVYEMLYANYNTTHCIDSTEVRIGTKAMWSQNQKPTKAKSQMKPTAKSQKTIETKAKRSQKPKAKSGQSQKAKSQTGMQMRDSRSQMQQIARKTAPDWTIKQQKKHQQKYNHTPSLTKREKRVEQHWTALILESNQIDWNCLRVQESPEIGIK